MANGHRAIVVLALVLVGATCLPEVVGAEALGGAHHGVAAKRKQSKRMSRKAFVKTANDICRQGTILREEAVDRHFGDLGEGRLPSAAMVDAFIVEYQPIVEQQIDSIDMLRPPAILQKKVDRLIDTARDALADVLANPMSVILAVVSPFEKVNRRSKALGLDRCAV